MMQYLTYVPNHRWLDGNSSGEHCLWVWPCLPLVLCLLGSQRCSAGVHLALPCSPFSRAHSQR